MLPKPPAALAGLTGVGACIVVVLSGFAAVVAFSASSGSYPNRSFRSASSRAFLSASSKSSRALLSTFFAPKPFFFAPRIFAFGLLAPPAEPVLRIADDDIARLAGRAAGSEGVSAFTSGDFGRVAAPLPLPLPLPFALRKGEAVRFTPAGVPARDGGLLGRLRAGLSQEVKKSSSVSPAGVLVPVPLLLASAMSSTVTSSGYLWISCQLSVLLGWIV